MVKRTDVGFNENITEADMRSKLSTLSYELKIEYLENLLKKIILPNDVKYSASKLLADLYLQKGWISSAAKAMTRAAETVTTYEARKEVYMNIGMLYVQAMEFVQAGDAFKKAMDAAAPGERVALQKKIRLAWMSEAERMEKGSRRPKALEVYDRLLRTTNDYHEQDMLMKRMMYLYEKLGRIKDAIALRENLKQRVEEKNKPQPVKEKIVTVDDILGDLD
jgi:tetratricopeptide (TPR) repeat protein